MSGEGDVQEKLEDIRVAVSRSSPMMEAINLVRACVCVLVFTRYVRAKPHIDDVMMM